MTKKLLNFFLSTNADISVIYGYSTFFIGESCSIDLFLQKLSVYTWIIVNHQHQKQEYCNLLKDMEM